MEGYTPLSKTSKFHVNNNPVIQEIKFNLIKTFAATKKNMKKNNIYIDQTLFSIKNLLVK